MNVALTRAKSSIFILGNASTLERSDEDWRKIVTDARQRSCLFDVGGLLCLFPRECAHSRRSMSHSSRLRRPHLHLTRTLYSLNSRKFLICRGVDVFAAGPLGRHAIQRTNRLATIERWHLPSVSTSSVWCAEESRDLRRWC